MAKLRESVWCVVPNATKHFLMLKRSKSSNNPHQWNFPGGGIDKEEDPKEAARREFREECGLEIPHWKKMFSLEHEDKKFHYYRPVIIPHIRTIFPNSESSDWNWVKRREADHLNLHRPTFHFFKTLSDRSNLRFRRQLVKSSLFQEITGSFEDGELFGHCLICIPTLRLHNVKVFPEYRNLGLAAALMEEVMRGDNRPLCLTANPEHGSIPHENLINFYEKFGFVVDTQVTSSLSGPTRMIYKDTNNGRK